MWYYLLAIVVGILLTSFYFKLSNISSSGMFNLIFLIVGLVAGIGAALFFSGKFKFGKEDTTIITSNTVVQSIERVFKVVTAEGHFSEIYDYSNTENVLSFIPSTKKALVVVNARVMMGFDFKKMKMEVDENTHKIKILEFPTPEILSIEPDLKYYNLENGLFNKFDTDDLTKLQADSKEKIKESVAKSDLPQIAQKQLKTLLVEMASMQHFQLEGSEKINSTPLLNTIKN